MWTGMGVCGCPPLLSQVTLQCSSSLWIFCLILGARLLFGFLNSIKKMLFSSPYPTFFPPSLYPSHPSLFPYPTTPPFAPSTNPCHCRTLHCLASWVIYYSCNYLNFLKYFLLQLKLSCPLNCLKKFFLTLCRPFQPIQTSDTCICSVQYSLLPIFMTELVYQEDNLIYAPDIYLACNWNECSGGYYVCDLIYE